jgi:hypothetical protein
VLARGGDAQRAEGEVHELTYGKSSGEPPDPGAGSI